MSEPERPLLNGLAARRRARQTAEAGERSFLRSLAVVGGLGWMIVLPGLGGLALGRWLDGRFASGIMWTAALLLVGLIVGCRLAWRRIHHP